ncbi:MAG TPA: rod shape-determining protein MreC [Thermomicrobiales bacterium]|nr:rod shape-determining protein MreC [Thermomicrobiales bacterium]
MTTISFRRTLSLAAVFVILSVALIILDRRDALDPVREGLSSLVSPVARGFNSVAKGPDFRTDVEKELERVQAELDAARAENAKLKAQIAEVEILNETQLAESARPELDYVSASVTGGDPTGAQHFIMIDKGRADGVEVGMAVTDPHFFVGQVVEVTDHTAKVMFIVDTSAQVGAQLVDSRADGIVVGQWQVSGRLLMQNVDRDAEVTDGEMVVTSSSVATETRGVPSDIVIGTVFGEPIPTQRTNEVAYEVRPAVDFDSLHTVWVVMPNDG